MSDLRRALEIIKNTDVEQNADVDQNPAVERQKKLAWLDEFINKHAFDANIETFIPWLPAPTMPHAHLIECTRIIMSLDAPDRVYWAAKVAAHYARWADDIRDEDNQTITAQSEYVDENGYTNKTIVGDEPGQIVRMRPEDFGRPKTQKFFRNCSATFSHLVYSDIYAEHKVRERFKLAQKASLGAGNDFFVNHILPGPEGIRDLFSAKPEGKGIIAFGHLIREDAPVIKFEPV